MPESSLIIRMGGDATGVDTATKAAISNLGELKATTIALGIGMAQLASKALEAGKALVESLVAGGLEAIDANSKLARNIDSTIDGLRALQLAAGYAGVSSEDLTKAVTRVNKVIGESMAGSASATAALTNLGLTAKQLAGLDADQKMAAIADAVKDMGMSAEQTQAMLADFGIRGEQMVGVFRAGGDDIRAASQEVKDFGLSVSQVDGAKVEQANDAFERTRLGLEALKNVIAISIAPALEALSIMFTDNVKEVTKFKDSATESGTSVAKTFGGLLVDAIHYVSIGITSLNLAASTLSATLATGFEVALNAVVAVNDAVLGMVNLVIQGLNLLGAGISEVRGLAESEFVQGIGAAAEATRQHVVDVFNTLQEKIAEPLPSGQFDEYYAKAIGSAQAVADGEAAIREQALANKQEWMSRKTAVELAQGEADFAALIEQSTAEINLAVDTQDTVAQAEMDGAKRVADFKKSLGSQQVGDLVSLGNQLLSTSAKSSKKMFDVQKGAAIASAMVSTFQGVATSLASYPMPLAAVMAALHLALGIAQVNNIRSQQYSGSGSTSGSGASGGGDAAASAATSAATASNSGSSASSGTLMVQGIDDGSLFSGKTVRALAERLQEHQANGGKVVLV